RWIYPAAGYCRWPSPAYKKEYPFAHARGSWYLPAPARGLLPALPPCPANTGQNAALLRTRIAGPAHHKKTGTAAGKGRFSSSVHIGGINDTARGRIDAERRYILVSYAVAAKDTVCADKDPFEHTELPYSLLAEIGTGYLIRTIPCQLLGEDLLIA